MSVCKFSSDYLMETFTLVDNLFINEYLPSATENQIKVYLYGLYLCSNPTSDSSEENLTAVLGLKPDELYSVFKFWEDNGLLQIISQNPLEVKYLSLKGAKQPPKKYKSEKYYDFNLQAQDLFSDRALVQNEFVLLYETMDQTGILPDAMLMIIQYCIQLKGQSIRLQYVQAVARSWAADGVRTAADVEAKLNEYDALDESMREILKALGRKSGSVDLEEKQAFVKWTKNWGFPVDAVIYAAKSVKGKGGFKKLDQILDEFYRLSVFSEKEMKAYNAEREKMRDLAIKVNSAIGVFYESVDGEIETYIAPWLVSGFDEEAVLTVAKYCFMSGIRTLNGMDSYVKKFLKMGLWNTRSINEYIGKLLDDDRFLKSVLELSGSSRSVTEKDRDYYRVWSMDWGFSDDVIKIAAAHSGASKYILGGINKTLAELKENKIETAAKAEEYLSSPRFNSSAAGTVYKNIENREYTKEELRSVFSDRPTIDDVEF